MKRGAPLKAKKPMRKRSRKREAYLASPERDEGKAHMARVIGLNAVSAKRRAHKAAEKAQGAWGHMERVKALPCVCCHAPPPSQAHHVTGDGKRRSDWRVIPLCYDCHQGPNGYHAAKRSWVERHGPDFEFLEVVHCILQSQ